MNVFFIYFSFVPKQISQIVHPSEITEVQLVESETLCHETEHMQIVSDEKLEDESELTETTVKLVQMESTSDELIEEKSNASLSSSVEQVSEKFEGSEVILQSTGEQVQGEETDAEMPKEESGQGIEAAEEPCDKHIEGEVNFEYSIFVHSPVGISDYPFILFFFALLLVLGLVIS